MLPYIKIIRRATQQETKFLKVLVTDAFGFVVQQTAGSVRCEAVLTQETVRICYFPVFQDFRNSGVQHELRFFCLNDFSSLFIVMHLLKYVSKLLYGASKLLFGDSQLLICAIQVLYGAMQYALRAIHFYFMQCRC